jgi:hypothetical protein
LKRALDTGLREAYSSYKETQYLVLQDFAEKIENE